MGVNCTYDVSTEFYSGTQLLLSEGQPKERGLIEALHCSHSHQLVQICRLAWLLLPSFTFHWTGRCYKVTHCACAAISLLIRKTRVRNWEDNAVEKLCLKLCEANNTVTLYIEELTVSVTFSFGYLLLGNI